MMRKRNTLRLIAVAIGALVAAPIQAEAQDWQAGAGADWQKVMAAARKEGKAVLAADNAVLVDALSKGFERDTGIKLEVLTGTPNDLSARLTREAKAGQLTIDVSTGGGTELITLYPERLLTPVKPQLILPGVTDPKNWVGGKIKWMDPEGQYLLQPTEYVSGKPVVNTDMIKPGSLANWKDLLKPEFKGKIAAYDPRPGGPGQALATYLAHEFGIEFVKQLYSGQAVTYTRDGRQLVEWAVRGTHPIVLAAVQTNIEYFRKEGFKNIATIAMADGPGNVLGGFGVLKQAKGVPHPNAAQVFINWYASKPGQEVYSKVMLEPSRRTDVKVPEVPDYVIPVPGMKYLDAYDPEFYVKTRPKIQEQLIEALGGR